MVVELKIGCTPQKLKVVTLTHFFYARDVNVFPQSFHMESMSEWLGIIISGMYDIHILYIHILYSYMSHCGRIYICYNIQVSTFQDYVDEADWQVGGVLSLKL